MAPPFFVYVTARFERDYRRLLKGHADLAADYETVLSALRADPYNRSRSYPIKKLEQVDAGDGQYRIRCGRFRFRYDIDGASVQLDGEAHATAARANRRVDLTRRIFSVAPHGFRTETCLLQGDSRGHARHPGLIGDGGGDHHHRSKKRLVPDPDWAENL